MLGDGDTAELFISRGRANIPNDQHLSFATSHTLFQDFRLLIYGLRIANRSPLNPTLLLLDSQSGQDKSAGHPTN